MEHYFQAKALLFEMTSEYNIVNIDDPYGKRLTTQIRNRNAQTVTYALDQPADYYASDIEYGIDYTRYTAHTPTGSFEARVSIPGRIYVYNSLAAIACADCYGIDKEHILLGLQRLEGIKGRLETVYSDKHYRAIVDFAHTEDGLEQAIATIKPFVKGRLILVFGVYAADGEEGNAKRRAMGRVAAQHADIAVVTSDNPKHQDPELILAEVVQSIEEHKGEYRAIVDRKEALEYAVQICEKDDVLLIAGKGHETSQIIGSTEIPFHEDEIVREAFRRFKGADGTA